MECRRSGVVGQYGMCGIAGIIALSDSDVSPRQLRAMTDAIRHRGPDDEGYAFIDSKTARLVMASGPASPPDVARDLQDIGTIPDGSGFDVGLAHRRFSIIDLSSGGHQPLSTVDGECVVVFNGEIYNFVEVRLELERLGRRFLTRSDTEVLVEAYRQWGCDCFARFNGFWAVAIHDARTRRVVVATDRLGKKPLYWTLCHGCLYFASEIKALLVIPAVAAKRQVNELATYRWLAYGLRDIDHETMFAGINRLPGGCWAVVDSRFPGNVVRYWEPPTERLSEKQISPREAVSETRRLLRRAVKLRLRADVPWCVELSGGIDSSVIVALTSEIESKPVTTFTVKFDDAEASEAHFARLVADRFQCAHHEIEPVHDGFWSDIRAFTHQMEEPYHAPNMHTHQAVWATMRRHGARVGLNGTGGDEVFAGYAYCFAPAIAQFLSTGQIGAALTNAGKCSEITSVGGRARRLLASLLHVVPGLATARLERAIQETHHWIRADFAPHPIRSRTLDAILLADLTRTRIPYWLMADDKAAMALPFEPRNPFMDYEVIDFACRLPASYLIRDGWHKWILRKVVEDLLPDDVLWRRTKMGFPFPERRFLQQSKDMTSLILRRIDNPYVDTVRLQEATGGLPDWRVMSFLLWYEMFINDNSSLFGELEDRLSSGGEAAPTGEPLPDAG